MDDLGSEDRERIAADIMVVDDDPRICRLLAHYLGRVGYGVRAASNGHEMRHHIAEKPPDLVIMDLILPHGDGLTLARELRAHSRVPIIILTARVGAEFEVPGLEGGADDYIVKPFNERILLARVHSVLRRTRLQERGSQSFETERGREDVVANWGRAVVSDDGYSPPQ
jgi:two-component system OmpR family response regulator